MCDDRSRKRNLDCRPPSLDRHSQPLSRDQIEQFYAKLAQAELNQDPRQMKLQWWSELSPGELRFQCSFKRPSIEAVDEVVKRLSGDSLGLGDPCELPPDESLESTVHRISIDMEAVSGRQPSMEELAAGMAIVAANHRQGQPWCEERLETMVNDRGMHEIPWDRSAKRHNRMVIPASMDMEEDPEPEPRRRSIGKDSTESADLDWLRQSSSAAIEALRSAHSWRAAPPQDMMGAAWQPRGNSTLDNSTPRTTIKAQSSEP